jgi:hypothetical protein
MPDERPHLTLIQGSKKPATVRIAAAFDAVHEMAENADQLDDLLYGPGGGPPPAPEREPVKVGERPASFRVVE